jgi:AraC-like DNA-binding protein
MPRLAPPAPAAPDAARLHRKYEESIHNHLGRLFDKLFTEFTGLHFHVAWAPAPAHEWQSRTLPTGCSVCCRLSGSPLLKSCRTCGPKQLTAALRADGAGHHFTCRLGVRNYWFPIRIRGDTLGIAYLQALEHAGARPTAQKCSARAAPRHVRRAAAKVLSRFEFTRAAKLLQLIITHVETASLSDLRKADLTSAGHSVLALEKEQARLHETLQHYLPSSPPTLHRPAPESHGAQVVHRLLEFIEANYGQRITLQLCASKLGMNAAYLSDLFSHALGVSFKTCLTGVRMAKAKTLLEDPAKNLSTVAYAVGYASENRFRAAFKQATGLPPKLWRETMQMGVPATSSP